MNSTVLFRWIQEKLQKIVFSSKANAASPEVVQELWNACADRLYSLEPKVLQLGLGEEVAVACPLMLCVLRGLGLGIYESGFHRSKGHIPAGTCPVSGVLTKQFWGLGL